MNNHILYPAHSPDISRGLFWPQHRALPVFATPADLLDAVRASALTPDEQLLFTCLQGLVNREQPRIFVIPISVGEGDYAWPDLLALSLREYADTEKWDLVQKYRDSLEGIVLYSTKKTEHMVNLATTLAGLYDLLPVSDELLPVIREKCPDLPVRIDLTTLPYDNPCELYQYVYRTYWPRCSHRLILSAAPENRHYTRDLAVACGSMVIWTENRDPKEKSVYMQFLRDMEPGNAIATGWYTEERSGIGAAAECGLSTVPSDFFANATVYAGFPHDIKIPAIPPLPALENKIYIAIYLSDGDNVQYNQHAMLNLWRNPERGTCPINWTISPALADFAPGMLNYYYRTASDGDCFVSGPSGLGYSLLVDRHNKRWNLTDRARAEAYARLTERYLFKTGIRSITVWDEMDEMHTEVYADLCRSLFGATMVEWNMGPKPLETMVVGDTAFIPNNPGYTPDIQEIYKVFQPKIQAWDHASPLFLSAQGVSWNMTPANIRELARQLDALAPGCIEIVRADHFFALYNEAHDMAYDLSLRPDVKTEEGNIDLGTVRTLTRMRICLSAGDGFTLSASEDGSSWTTLEKTPLLERAFDFDLPAVPARWLRITTNNGARVVHTEVYGK